MQEPRYRQAEQLLFADAGIDPAEHRISLSRTGTTARVLEVGSGTPLVFLHGGPIAAATWAYLVARLDGHRCLLVDRPGCGLSEPPEAVPDVDRLPGYVADLTADVLDAFALDRASLVGSSFGGYSALRSALALPTRVDRVVVAGFPAFGPGWSEPGFFTLLRTPVLGRLLLAAPATRASARMSLKQLGHARSLDEGRIPPPMIEWTRAWQRWTDTMRNDAAMIVGLGTRSAGFAPQLDLRRDELERITSPCLIVAPTDDPVGGVPEARRLAQLLPNATVEVVERAGHLPWLDAPDRVAELIERFVPAHAEGPGR